MNNILQVSGPQLTEAVDQLTQSSIQIAQAVSDYGALKVIFGIFLIFIIIIMVLFIYQVITLNNKVSDIASATSQTKTYLEGVSEYTIGRTQANIVIRRCINSMSISIKYNILKIRLENNISDKSRTKEKIHKISRNEFSELHTFLGNLYYDTQPLSYVLREEDLALIEEFIIEQVYIPKETFQISLMDQSVNLFVNGLKLEYLQKL